MNRYLFYVSGSQWWIWSETRGEWVCCPGAGAPFTTNEGRVKDVYAPGPFPKDDDKSEGRS